jgi:uncharacterized membrane protein YphA (DoxX/SURF4 family)
MRAADSYASPKPSNPFRNTPMRAFRHVLSWVFALLLIGLFVHSAVHPWPAPPAGSVKLMDLPGENIVFQTLATRSGISLFEPAGRVITALVELFAALLLVLPFSRRLGALLSTLVLGGAVGLHLSPWLGRDVPVSLGSETTDGGQLFMLAVLMLVVSLLLLMVHPGKSDAARGRKS